jgi:hypothetical protein
MRMLKKVIQRGRRGDKPQAYRYFTHPALSQQRLAPSPGYVEDFGEPRTKLGKERVLARLGKGGCNSAFFSILKDSKQHE